MNQSKWCIVGIADHQGVMNVGGRIGSADGPAAFRKIFYRLKGSVPVIKNLADDRDVSGLSTDVEKNHRQAADVISAAHGKYRRTVVVGGGHDHGFSHLLGIQESMKKKTRLGCINIDAHLDCRKPSPQITSGSPFYLALEKKVIDPARLIEFGIQSHCNGPELWEYVEKKKIPVVPFSRLRSGKAVAAFSAALKKLRKHCDAVVVSLDLDAVLEASAPGVSAPQAEGFFPDEIMQMMEIAGADRKVVSLGIFELNPLHDIGERTARLAATAAYHFIEAGY